jgi:hypothetical protein
MTETERFTHEDIAIAVVVVIVQVGAAETSSLNRDLNLIGC